MRFCLLAIIALVPLPFAAQAQSAPSSPPQSIGCEGPIRKDTTYAQLQKLFGAANITTEDVAGAEGEQNKVTVVFAKTPAKRLEISWSDDDKRDCPASITISANSKWTGPLGLRSGMLLADVARINGQPITINGFEWDYGGYAVDLKGKLAQLPGKCSVMLRFSPEKELPANPKYEALTGEKTIDSDDALLLSVKPKLSEWTISFDE